MFHSTQLTWYNPNKKPFIPNIIQMTLSLSVLRQNEALGHWNWQTWVASIIISAQEVLENLPHLFFFIVLIYGL